jgi:hypothetical protein
MIAMAAFHRAIDEALLECIRLFLLCKHVQGLFDLKFRVGFANCRDGHDGLPGITQALQRGPDTDRSLFARQLAFLNPALECRTRGGLRLRKEHRMLKTRRCHVPY